MEIIKVNRYQWIVIFFGVFFLLVLQAGFAQSLVTGSFANLLLLFGIVAAMHRNVKAILIIALMLGILSDFASGLPDGVFLIAFPLTLLCLYYAANNLLSNLGNNYLQLLVMAGAVVLFYLITFLVIFLFEILGLIAGYSFIQVSRGLWLELLLNLIFFYPVYLYYRMVTKLSRYEN